MSYLDKYIKYKNKYLQLKNNDTIQIAGAKTKEKSKSKTKLKDKTPSSKTTSSKTPSSKTPSSKTPSSKTPAKCYIDDTDKVLFGDGGSSAIIVITKDKKVYKIFTLYIFNKDLYVDKIIVEQNNRVKNEIKIYELLTEEIINKNISKHFVKYFGHNDCANAKKLFNKCPSKYTEFLAIDDEKKDKLCKNYYKNYPNNKLQDEYKILQIEYCDYSCADFIKDISKISEIEIEKYLDIFFFQIIYSILSVQKVFPYFTHNDLFMRNILGVREKDNNNYYTYKFNDKTYYIPQKLFYPKINDFGMTNINEEYKDCKLYKSMYKDIYTIMFDIYNGGNLGASSLSSLNEDNDSKKIFLKKYFNNFFNVDIIDNYKKSSPNNMNWDWDNILDDDFMGSIQMKNPLDLMNGYFYDIFGKKNINITTVESD
jgi:hypothetical protein